MFPAIFIVEAISKLPLLSCPLAHEHDVDGFEEDVVVHPDGPVHDVICIQHDPEPVVGVASAGNLPQPGDAGLDPLAQIVVLAVIGDLFPDDGTGTDDGHGAVENIPELGQFIK